MKFHFRYDKKEQTEARTHRFVQQLTCYVFKYITSSIFEKKLLSNRAQIVETITKQVMKIKIEKNNKTKFIEAEESNKGKKSNKQIEKLIEIENDEDEMSLK